MAKPQVTENTDEGEGFVDELKPGTKLMHGQYTIESFLNAGGFGITYLARDSLDRKIVIKECFPGAFCRRSRYIVQARSRAHQNELKSIVRLFVQEARSLSKLSHPNIVGVHQVFEDNDTAYMALDFVEGRDLLDTIEDPNHGLTPTQIKAILKEVLGAIGFIHDQGILHRDISPDNILINKSFHPVLIDFGAAREEATKQSRVLSALRVVKDGYSPQEFYIAGSAQSPSSDLYALAASFHHLIAMEVPPNSQARLAAIASAEPDPYVPLAGRFPEYEDDFLAAIDKALCVLPKDRLQSAKEWLDMMDGNQGNVTPLNVGGAVPTAAVHAEAPKSKMPLLLGSAAAVALLIGVGVMTMTGGQDAATPAPAVATSTAPTTAPTAAPTTAALPEPSIAATDDVAVAIAEPEAVVPAPVIIAEPAPVETPPAPVIVEDAAPVIVDAPAPVIVGGPVIVDDVAPEQLRPTTRPQNIEVAALPEPVAPPLPEPVETPRPVVAEPVAGADFPDQTGNRPSADTQTADLDFPATPDAIAAVGTGPEVDIAAITPGNELPTADVAKRWAVLLPFDAASAESNTIGQVGAVSPVWVSEGLMITSVNGIPIENIAEISAILRNTVSPAPTDTIEVTFGTLDPASGATGAHSWRLQVVDEIALSSGVRFQTTRSGSDWQTSVVAVPADAAGDLRIGDVMTSYIPTSENIAQRESLFDILNREIDNGTEQFMFAVQREGSMWVASLSYAGSEN